ncbi:hypothetical protein Q5M85_19970 [Paraclostridium bifermentans]|nr:hypothetical protein [Paraclostridium bifermentans]
MDIKTLEIFLNDKTKELEISLNNLNKLREYNENISKQLEGEISKSNEIKSSMEELKSNVEKIKLEFNTLLKNLGFKDFNNYEEFKSKIYLITDLEKK